MTNIMTDAGQLQQASAFNGVSRCLRLAIAKQANRSKTRETRGITTTLVIATHLCRQLWTLRS